MQYTIYFYKETIPSILNFQVITDDLRRHQISSTVIRDPLETYYNIDYLQVRINDCKVYDLKKPLTLQPSSTQVEQGNLAATFGEKTLDNITAIYDGYCLQSIYRELLPFKECNLYDIHIIFTNMMIATFDEGDYKYHGRALVCGTPSIISTCGIINAPARPREFYFPSNFKQSGLSERYLDYSDPRINNAAVGYILQALFFFILKGDPFCDDKHCRLYNAHWQEELIETQVRISNLCSYHSMLLQAFLNKR